METNDSNSTKPQLLWDAAKAVLRGKYIAIQEHLKKVEQSQMNSLTTIIETGKRRTNEA